MPPGPCRGTRPLRRSGQHQRGLERLCGAVCGLAAGGQACSAPCPCHPSLRVCVWKRLGTNPADSHSQIVPISAACLLWAIKTAARSLAAPERLHTVLNSPCEPLDRLLTYCALCYLLCPCVFPTAASGAPSWPATAAPTWSPLSTLPSGRGHTAWQTSSRQIWRTSKRELPRCATLSAQAACPRRVLGCGGCDNCKPVAWYPAGSHPGRNAWLQSGFTAGHRTPARLCALMNACTCRRTTCAGQLWRAA